MTCSRISAAPSPPPRRDARRPQGALHRRSVATVHRRLELRRLCRPDRSGEGATAVPLNSIGTDKAELQIESPLRHADRIEDVRAMAKALSQHAVPDQLALASSVHQTGGPSRCESCAALILAGRELRIQLPLCAGTAAPICPQWMMEPIREARVLKSCRIRTYICRKDAS